MDREAEEAIRCIHGCELGTCTECACEGFEPEAGANAPREPISLNGGW